MLEVHLCLGTGWTSFIMDLHYREAVPEDIGQIHFVRMEVKENTLSDPSLITLIDYEQYLFSRGKGFVCLHERKICGFAIVDLLEKNVWALFVHPSYEGKGIGKALHDKMIVWYFSLGNESIWLGTAPNTRAERFYRRAGWKEAGTHGNGEIKFEMDRSSWQSLSI